MSHPAMKALLLWQSPVNLYPSHGLHGKIKEEVYNYFMEIQEGKCFICGISQDDLIARRDASTWKHAKSPVHWKLQIDHCHTTGYLRGLLCEHCNSTLGFFEEYAFRSEYFYFIPSNEKKDVNNLVDWIKSHQGRIFQYMQPDRWKELKVNNIPPAPISARRKSSTSPRSSR